MEGVLVVIILDVELLTLLMFFMMKDDELLLFLYKTAIGRCILRILVSPCVSNIVGKFLDTRLSTILIKKFVENNNIDLIGFEDKKYESFNDFFTRKKISQNIDKKENSFICPCDGYLSVYKIEKNSTFRIKNSIYTIESLIQDRNLASKYMDGYCLIFRLSPTDYHRYCYIDNGEKGSNNFIKGILHSVRAVAVENYKVFKTNSREWSMLKTENFGDIIQIEVGALLVGKINNYHDEYLFKRGEEKGKFEYGGSTIVLLVQADKVNIHQYILNNSEKNKETFVTIGKKIGTKVN